jgi:hypothetical protein
VFNRDPALLEGLDRSAELLGGAFHYHGYPPRRGIDLRFAVADRSERVRDIDDILAIPDVHLDHVAPRALLQFGGHALRDGFAMVDDHDLVSEVIRFV